MRADNLVVVHAFVQVGIPQSDLMRYSFFDKVGYQVSSCYLSPALHSRDACCQTNSCCRLRGTSFRSTTSKTASCATTKLLRTTCAKLAPLLLPLVLSMCVALPGDSQVIAGEGWWQVPVVWERRPAGLLQDERVRSADTLRSKLRGGLMSCNQDVYCRGHRPGARWVEPRPHSTRASPMQGRGQGREPQ